MGFILHYNANDRRIEDGGFINLSGSLPSSPDEIEALMKLEGVAQRKVGLPARDR